jgi:REP element-mobilizing transposase RayT
MKSKARRQDASATKRAHSMPRVRIRKRKRLPHWEADEAIYFVTFRLADSLPQSVLASLESIRESGIEGARKQFRETESCLDRGVGACHLRVMEVAQLVADTLRKFDDSRYRLFAWCIMPNHVHSVFQPYEPYRLASILHSWKSYSAASANNILKRSGPFWQREYYDHLIRNGDQLDRAIRYTAENPVRAKLKNWKWVYVSKDWT